ncbi:MAG: adenylate/guanylate cyclase domain-containing protein [Leptospirales bacterium]|nr:adenylate/guanylate cyclase domain-containing protein [Leptospirales bacterium]
MQRLQGWIQIISGHPAEFKLEHRLFNGILFLIALANILGLPFQLILTNAALLIQMQALGTFALMGPMYYMSRVRKMHKLPYAIATFVSPVTMLLNAVVNAGTMGGAHYYFIPVTVILMAAAPAGGIRILAAVTTISCVAILVWIEKANPEWIVPYTTVQERMLDVPLNLLGAMLFSGVVVLVLLRSYTEERNRSDRLLHSIFPDEVVSELAHNGKSEPREYGSASVLFADMVGFTQVASTLSAAELVQRLDGCFTAFDAIVARHGLEKIKTIGDAYMAVAGVPLPLADHEKQTVSAAMEMIQWMHENHSTHGFTLRVGIHSGPLVAGVIGKQKLAYDVWGDTVNTASRMESASLPGRVNISEATKRALDQSFQFEERGSVEVRGKGQLPMYFVNSGQPSA